MTDLYASVYHALDAAVANSLCLASSDAHVQRALTHFRGTGNDREAMKQLESISVLLHRLSLASLGNDRDTRQAVIDRLQASAAVWMNRLPIH